MSLMILVRLLVTAIRLDGHEPYFNVALLSHPSSLQWEISSPVTNDKTTNYTKLQKGLH